MIQITMILQGKDRLVYLARQMRILILLMALLFALGAFRTVWMGTMTSCDKQDTCVMTCEPDDQNGCDPSDREDACCLYMICCTCCCFCQEIERFHLIKPVTVIAEPGFRSQFVKTGFMPDVFHPPPQRTVARLS